MRLVRVNPHRECSLLCVQCGRMHPCSEMFADLDGKPFESYHCKQCAKSNKLEFFFEPSNLKAWL